MQTHSSSQYYLGGVNGDDKLMSSQQNTVEQISQTEAQAILNYINNARGYSNIDNEFSEEFMKEYTKIDKIYDKMWARLKKDWITGLKNEKTWLGRESKKRYEVILVKPREGITN